MSGPVVLPLDAEPRLRRRLVAHLAIAAARLLAHQPPRRIRAVLTVVRVGAAPATPAQALAARDTVTGTSMMCAGPYCLPRSLATALLCRLHGTWPTWCAGVRTGPFAAHAWVEVDSEPIGEPTSAGYYRALMTVPPLTTGSAVAHRLSAPVRLGGCR
ncbi:lasso peptide biosynthesis B2 protein [Nocardia terpenica]|uniref:lasso peptide biosynthesis B2 protein n=1 Tax=Nocardia terpenica TaxID=455432 RepID=UPI0009EED294|nr:lasso peptide biosynthesis B2 protein [Nocardia terpenica]NQE92395.1 lasso peptide biosynthesis B2 protein [Nocardia terpenica]